MELAALPPGAIWKAFSESRGPSPQSSGEQGLGFFLGQNLSVEAPERGWGLPGAPRLEQVPWFARSVPPPRPGQLSGSQARLACLCQERSVSWGWMSTCFFRWHFVYSFLLSPGVWLVRSQLGLSQLVTDTALL